MGGNTELFKIVAALRDSLFMRVDLAYILPMHAVAREQVVIDLEAKAPHDGKRVLSEKVVEAFTEPAVEFSIGSTPKSQRPSRTARNTPSKVLKNVMPGTRKSLHAAIWL